MPVKSTLRNQNLKVLQYYKSMFLQNTAKESVEDTPSENATATTPLLWSCFNSTSAAAELLQLAKKSQERSGISNIDKSPASLSPPVSCITNYKPILKFSVNAILSRDNKVSEDQKHLEEIKRRSPSPLGKPLKQKFFFLNYCFTTILQVTTKSGLAPIEIIFTQLCFRIHTICP